MSNPTLLLCDEISLGLAPIVIRDIYARIPAIVAEGLSLVIVEQDIVQALKTARHVYCLQEGRVALHGEAKKLTREKISAAYFGVCDCEHGRQRVALPPLKGGGRIAKRSGVGGQSRTRIDPHPTLPLSGGGSERSCP